MPAIPYFQPSTAPSGAGSIVPARSSAPDLSGLMRGVQTVENTAAYIGERDRRQRERELAEQQRAAEIADHAKAQRVELAAREAMADRAEALGNEVVDGQADPTSALTTWDEQARTLVAAQLESVPPAHREAVGAALELQASRFGRYVGKAVRKRDQTDTLATIQETVAYAERMALADYPGADKLVDQTLMEFGGAAGLNAKQMSDVRREFQQSAAANIHTRRLSAAKDDPRLLATVRAEINEDQRLDPKAQTTLLDRAESYAVQQEVRRERALAQAQAAADRRQRAAEARYTAASGLAMVGTLDQTYADETHQALKEFPQLASAFRQMVQQQKVTGAIAAQPMPALRATLDRLSSQVAQAITPENRKLLQDYQAIVRGGDTDIKQHGALRAHGMRGGAMPPPLDFSVGVEGLLPQLAERAPAVQAANGWAGGDYAPLYPEEVPKLAAALSTLQPEQFGEAVASLAGVVPTGQLVKIAREIDAQDKPLALAMAAGADRTPQGLATAALIRHGARVVKDRGVKEDTAAEYGLKALIAREAGNDLPEAARADVIEAARYVYLGSRSALGSQISVEKALELAMNSEFVEHNEQRLPVPRGVDLERRLQTYPRQAIEAQTKDGWVYLAGSRQMGVPEFLASLPSATLEPVGRGQFRVRSGPGSAMNHLHKPIVLEIK